MRLSFGQPTNSIIQTAYIVAHLEDEIQRWIDDLNVGPWFVLEDFKGEEAIYRGKPSKASVKIGMAFAGHMMIELLQPNDDHPSVYKETREARGYGFHHFGVGSPHFGADVQRLERRGYDLAFQARVPTDDRVAYLDTKGELPGFLELIEVSEGMDEFFGRCYAASVGWDGKEPLRPFT
ncbi:glyoxalase [Salinisphaera orenii MK-B5]|uniref:Glyoxalase n=1 Tax=Salinisphaera orenii MK-B5 TaxID=856730 RepID=A0A423PPS3_9GAMM|nr:VOC family protein [Salinisphaera orenii]ROO27626.1 glyoxalase [Salinisphaera orenii MK-B5]